MTKVVIGAGVTGLSFAHTYAGEVDIFESESDLGGKAMSYKVNTDMGQFGFDVGGHWFHHKNAPDALKLLKGLSLDGHIRHAYVYLDDMYYKYPLQHNYNHHPNRNFVRRVEDELKETQRLAHSTHANYEDFLIDSFGLTLYETFFRDYNMKIFGSQNLCRRQLL